MKSLARRLVWVALAVLSAAGAYGRPLYYQPELADKLGLGAKQRIEAIAATLQESPKGFAVSVEERSFWDAAAAADAGKKLLQEAQTLIEKPLPVLTDELYLRYSKDGNRTAAQEVMFARQNRLTALCLAECMENKGRFIKPLEDVIDAIVSDRTWVLPAHDKNLENFYQKTITIDLNASANAHNLAICLSMLEGRIDRALAMKTKKRIHKLVLAPYVMDVFDRQDAVNNWWKTCTHNWNSVCHAGVAGAAVTLLPDKMDRALFIERAMFYMDYYYQGFTPDGYCSEGLGYWNYGYGNYIVLSELIDAATQGKTDLFSDKRGLPAALYPYRIEITNNQYPALADCTFGDRPSAAMMGYVNLRLGLNDARWPLANEFSGRKHLFDFLMLARLDDSRPVIEPPFKPDHDQLRSFFADAGVLICRPTEKTGNILAALLKGGHNAEHHNHNDVGTFIAVLDGTQLIVDPGSTEYTKTTFSKDRYTIKKLASYGHPVPLVAGLQQAEGRWHQATILKHQFTDEIDILIMDLKSAYPVQELQKLERTFVYSRPGSGSLTVTDNFEFSTPQTFETALITYGTYVRTAENRLELSDHGKAVIVEIQTDGVGLEIADEVIESTKGSPLRIALRFQKPLKKGQISTKIWPK